MIVKILFINDGKYKMCETDKFIQLLKDNNHDELEKIYIKHKWLDNIDFKKVYQAIKDIENKDDYIHNIFGLMYKYGNGVEKDYAKALHYYRLAAKQGSNRAQRNLGRMYQKGYGVEIDYAKALRYFQLSAEQNDSFAQHGLVVMYCYSRGVEQNYTKAFHYCQLSAEQGNSFAQDSLKFLLQKEEVQQLLRRRIKPCRQA